MSVFEEQKVITVCMAICFGFSILMRLALGFMYSHLIKEADNMASTKNKLLKQCKTKFTNCYEMNNGVSNISVYTDKFINRLALGPISFRSMYHLSGQLMLLSIVFSGVGVCRSIAQGRTVGAILPFYIAGFMGLYVFFSVSTIVDMNGKRNVLKINLVDYLENHLSPRIHVTNRNIEMLYGEEFQKESLSGRRKGATVMSMSGRDENSNYDLKKESEKVSEEELEALLKEFLTG